MNYWTTYYWAIDEVLTGGGTAEGVVWSFTTQRDPNMPDADYYVDGVKGSDGNPRHNNSRRMENHSESG